MLVTRTVFVRFRFEAFHRWPDAPPEHDYLAVRHRHLFHVEARAKVGHEHRDIEFIDLKRRVHAYCSGIAADEISGHAHDDPHASLEWSCESWAEMLLLKFDALYEVSVSEDGENGATVVATER